MIARHRNELAVIIAGTSWDGMWMPERHMALQLARRLPVLWVDPAISYLTPLRTPAAAGALREPRLRLVAPNISRLSPLTVPGVTRPILREIAIHQAQRVVRRAVERAGARVRCTIVAGLDDMLDVVDTEQRVFYGTDDFVAGAQLMGTDERWLRAREQRQLQRADTVVAISPVLAEKWSVARPDVAVIGNGCDVDHYADVDDIPSAADVRLPTPIAGFVGHMSERIDLAMLEAVAQTGVSLLLVGPRQRTFEIAKLDALLARPNVQWVGSRPFSELPSYLAAIDVGLTPYRQSDFNKASFPLKTLEYLAAGRPAVVSDLPAHRAIGSAHVRIAATPQQFAQHTGALLRSPRRAMEVVERRAVAALHSWEVRADEICELLGLDELAVAPSRAA
jgi:teichuronic acid biosynthesis glycosyltransferase TuaH